MKPKLLLAIILLITTGSAFSQNPDSTIILHEGKLTYVQHSYRVQSLESTILKGRHYQDQYVTSFPDYEARKRIFRTVFSKKRATELNEYRLGFTFYFDGITKKLVYMYCLLLDDNKLRLTLDELDRLEKAFKSLDYKFSSVKDKPIIDWFAIYAIAISFDKLYNDSE